MRGQRLSARLLLPGLVIFLAATDAHAVPSFARQLEVPCNACHTRFPELNAFGRQFKLSGYALAADAQIESSDRTQDADLSIARLPPVAMMFQAAYTQTSHSVPESQGDTLQLPQQLSVFLAGKISPKAGSFLQLTYSQADDKFGIDNTEFRFAGSKTVKGKLLNYGVTLNNAPGVEDLWNSTPVWGFPWSGPDVSPAPMAATLIDGQLSQDVAGVGAFVFVDSKFYAATSLYRSAHLGQGAPALGSENTIDSVAPYWRLAWQHADGDSNLEIGAFGLTASLIPEGIVGPSDDFRDVAMDFQYETAVRGRRIGFHGAAIHEHRNLQASLIAGAAERASSDLDALKLDASYYRRLWGITLAYFATSGDRDRLLFAPSAVDGSVDGSPDSRGWVLQATHSPWQNVQIALQYTAYAKFNGASHNYDGFGRNAADNDTLYLNAWFNW